MLRSVFQIPVGPNMTINVFLNEQCKDALNLTDFVQNFYYDPNKLLLNLRHLETR